MIIFNKKKNIFISIILLIICVLFYSWSVTKHRRELIIGIESSGGMVSHKQNSWVDSLPISLKSIARKFIYNNVNYIEIKGGNYNNLDMLRYFKDLEELFLIETSITDLSELRYTPKLISLDISWQNIENIHAIKNLVNLNRLFLNNTEVKDISPVSNLIHLKILDLSYTKVKDLSPILDLKNLDELNIKGLSIDHKQLEKLKKYIPNCNINS